VPGGIIQIASVWMRSGKWVINYWSLNFKLIYITNKFYKWLMKNMYKGGLKKSNYLGVLEILLNVVFIVPTTVSILYFTYNLIFK